MLYYCAQITPVQNGQGIKSAAMQFLSFGIEWRGWRSILTSFLYKQVAPSNTFIFVPWQSSWRHDFFKCMLPYSWSCWSCALAATLICFRGNVCACWDITWVFHSLLATGADSRRATGLWLTTVYCCVRPFETDISPDGSVEIRRPCTDFLMIICKSVRLRGIVKGANSSQVLFGDSLHRAKIRI